jgi:hypothetical protein
MSDPESGLFDQPQALDSRGAMAMVDAMNAAFSYAKVRGGTHPGMFLRMLHSKGFKIEPCDPIPLEIDPPATEGE